MSLATYDPRYQRARALYHKQQAARVQAGGRATAWGAGWLPREDGHVYEPNAGQLSFHNSKARFRALVGGRGSGKTTGGAQEALRRIRLGLPGAVMNPDFENFKTSTWPEFRRWIPWEHVLEKDRHKGEFGWEPHTAFHLHFDTGATVICKGLKDPDAARGPNINWLWYDEGARDRKGTSFQNAIAGVRVGDDPTAFVTTTPRGVYSWLYKMFVLNEIPDYVQAAILALGITDKLYEVFFASIHDNKANLDPLFYLSMVTAYTGREADQELEGQFTEGAEGLVYANFSTENITDEEPDPERAIELAFDDGFVDPRAFLLIQKHPTHILIFDELYHRRHIEEECVGELMDMLGARFGWKDKDGKVPAKLPEIAVGSPEAKTLHRHFRKADIPVRSQMIPGVAEALRPVRRLICDGQGVRALRVHKRCKNFIDETVHGYRYPDGGTRSDSEKPLDENNHCLDALRDWTWVRARN